MKCYCISDSRYWDAKDKCVTREVEKYIRECAKHALDVYTKAEEIEDPIERRSFLSGGLTSLATLKEYNFDDVLQARAHFYDLIPFKLKNCVYLFKCCGDCIQFCPHRCVQDVLHRYYLWCNNCYLGYDSPRDIQIMTKKLMDPRVTYDDLLSMMYDKISPVKNKRLAKDLKEEVYDENPYLLNYEPITTGHISPTGRFVKDYDPDTGLYNIIQWPDSGLCPYCSPDATMRLKPGRRKARNEITELLRERKLKR